jgi:hypothetical protein
MAAIEAHKCASSQKGRPFPGIPGGRAGEDRKPANEDGVSGFKICQTYVKSRADLALISDLVVSISDHSRYARGRDENGSVQIQRAALGDALRT